MTKKQTDTSRAPYHDDYNEDKNFLQILFQPQTVQVRELNQLQTILQNQITRFGNHVFKEGAVVIPGGFQIANQEVSLGFRFTVDVDADFINSFSQVYVRKVSNNRRVLVSVVSEGDANHENFVFGSTTYAGDDTANFMVSDEVVFETTDQGGQTTIIGQGIVTIVGKGTIATIERGVYYIRGYFVLVNKQTIVVDAYQHVQNARVGLEVREDIITASQDNTLYSNASGEPNEKAEGANRFVISLKLQRRDNNASSENFIELVRVTDENKQTPVITSDYSLLEKAMAQRTYEESGDYTVGSYTLDMREHSAVFPSNPDPDKCVAVLSSGVSYVKGHRVQNVDPFNLIVDKSRETTLGDNMVVGINYSGFLALTGMKGVPEPSTASKVELYDTSNNKVGEGVLIAYRIGQAFMSGLRDIGNYKVTTATKMVQRIGGATIFEATVTNASLSGDNRALLFPLPVTGAKSLFGAGSSNVLYRVSRTYEVQLVNGVATISAGPADLLFDPDFSGYIFGSRNVGSGGALLDVSYSRGGAEQGSNLTITSLGNQTGTYFLIAKMIKRSTSMRTKILTQQVDTLTMSTSGVLELSKVDGLELISVAFNGQDVTSEYTFNGGQTDTHYGLATLTSNSPVTSPRSLVVTYTYFSHGSGDYFGADSYSSIPRERRLRYTLSNGVEYNLRDVVDFRPTITSSFLAGGNFIYPDTSMIADIEFYLPRIDTIIVSYENGYQVIKGISSNQPQRPVIPQNSMRLFDIVVPAYTPDVDEIWVLPENNKRYTMKDISRLENRISNLEYYTSLSTLEADTTNIQAVDPVTGQNRFKNGIFADPLTDFRLVDVESSSMSIEASGEGQMHPRLIQNSLDFEMFSGGVVNDDMVSPAYTQVKSIEQPFATGVINVNPYAVFSWNGFVTLSPSQDFWVDVKYVAPRVINETINYRGAASQGVMHSNWSWTGWRNEQVRTVTTTVFTETNTQSVRDNLIQTRVIPFMRSINITFRANSLRPTTRVYPFFNGVNVSAYVNQTGKSKGEPLVTDANGSITGVFTVPNNSNLRFSTGRTAFVLIDNPKDPKPPRDDTFTYATANFESGGREDTRQLTITNTRILGFTQRSQNEYRRFDPVAQSFACTTQGGEFMSAVEVFFFSKSRNIPVVLELRGMENGLPTHEVIGRKVLNPEEVNTSVDCNVPTRFTFPHPVYIEQDQEYCIVILANTQDYEVGYAELGQKILGTGYAVAKQPNTGVMFTSANGSSWTPHQNRDLKFTTYRCKWGVGSGQIVFRPKNRIDAIPLGENPISGVLNQSKLTIYQEGHGMRAGQTVKISNCVGGLGLPSTQINGEREIVNVIDHDRYEISTNLPLTETGTLYQPSDTPILVETCYPFNLLFTNLNMLLNDSISLSYEMRFMTDTGLSPWMPLTPKTDTNLGFEGKYIETTDFEIRANFTTTDNIAPQIDLHGFTTVLNSYYIDTDPSKGRFSYVSKPLNFSNPCTKMQFYLNVLLPGTSSFKAYVQNLDTEGSDWQEINASTSIFNDASKFVEYKFEYELIQANQTFSSIRIKFDFFGSRVSSPIVRDIRGVAFA
ncbi:hypothetical protein Kuja_1830 [Vibrio phage vB_VchM_Kuja]|uniref:DUF4815 domain-containing protein n=1 Tax=Vibrio phage vB_VchM_Kuja TaxID=2686437 RepID=A0A6B9J5P0_9CAUD|nr:hypothetical protein HWC83_gp052 [Vibrio phage vB_VchM_Kuja]QGZ16175.1 hypothetical protein Kuja_1830 [Vibrio phage vB_VchM_Kuja]